MLVAARTLLFPSRNWTAPMRWPGASGAKVTSTVQVVAELYVWAEQRVALVSFACRWKSRLGAPLVRTLMLPMVVPAATL